MTSTASGSTDEWLATLLDESDLEADDRLVAALTELRALGEVPLDAVTASVAAPTGRVRRLPTKGVVIVSLAAVLTVGTGLSAAASPDLRTEATRTIGAIVDVIAPAQRVVRPPASSTAPTEPPAPVVATRPSATTASTVPPTAAVTEPLIAAADAGAGAEQAVADADDGHGRSTEASDHGSSNAAAVASPAATAQPGERGRRLGSPKHGGSEDDAAESGEDHGRSGGSSGQDDASDD